MVLGGAHCWLQTITTYAHSSALQTNSLAHTLSDLAEPLVLTYSLNLHGVTDLQTRSLAALGALTSYCCPATHDDTTAPGSLGNAPTVFGPNKRSCGREKIVVPVETRRCTWVRVCVVPRVTGRTYTLRPTCWWRPERCRHHWRHRTCACARRYGRRVAASTGTAHTRRHHTGHGMHGTRGWWSESRE